MEEEEEAAAVVVVVVVAEVEEEEEAAAEAWEGKESSCPVSEERREQERRSTVCREVQRRSNGTHCSVTFTQPETHKHRQGGTQVRQHGRTRHALGSLCPRHVKAPCPPKLFSPS